MCVAVAELVGLCSSQRPFNQSYRFYHGGVCVRGRERDGGRGCTSRGVYVPLPGESYRR